MMVNSAMPKPSWVSRKARAISMVATGTVEEAADRLVQLALRSGGPDNITVVIGEVAGDEDTYFVEAMEELGAGETGDVPDTSSTAGFRTLFAERAVPESEDDVPGPVRLADDGEQLGRLGRGEEPMNVVDR